MFRNRLASSSNVRSALIALLLAGTSTLITGCGIGTAAPDSGNPIAPQTISGVAHGGNGLLGNANVYLFIAGNSGYGSGAAPVASTVTSTDGTGSFSFNPSSYTCTAGQPAYIEIMGGDSTGGTAAPNTATALLAPLGTCPSLNAYTVVNEATTVATIFAAGQYFNANAGTVGAATGSTPADPNTYTYGTLGAPNTTQAHQGLLNAIQLAGALVPPFSGVPNTTFNPGSAVTGVTVTGTPDAGKLGAIADILASCVNTASSTSNTCSDLLMAAVGSPLPATTSGSTTLVSSKFPAATNTMMAAYYMATNPVLAGSTSGTSGTVASACHAAANSTTVSNITCLYDLIASAGVGFSTTGFSAQPSDWTLAVAYTGSGTCSNGGALIDGPFKGAVDANGNFWYINGTAAASNLVELSPTGAPMACLGDANTTSGRGMTIDANNNVWGSFNGGALTDDIQEVVGGTSNALLTWPITFNSANTYYMTADGNGNVFYSTIGSGGGVSEIIDPGTVTTPFQPQALVASGLDGSSNNSVSGMTVDSANQVWVTFYSSSGINGLYPGAAQTPMPVTAYAIASAGATTNSTVTFTTNTTLTAGTYVTIADSSPLNGQSFAVLASPAPTATSFAVSYKPVASSTPTTTETGTATPNVTYTAGAYPGTLSSATYGLAADGAGFIYTGYTCCGTTTLRKMLKITPGATAATTGAATASAQDLGGINGVRSVAVDGAGNLWAGNEFAGTGTSITNGTYAVSEMTSSFVAISPGTNPGSTNCTTSVGCPSGGYVHAGLGLGQDIEVDISGNVWAPNNALYTGSSSSLNTGTSIVELVGAAVPVVNPVAVGVKTSKLGAKP